MTKMKTISWKNFIPEDPAIRGFLKRIFLIVFLFGIIGTLITKFGIDYPVVATGILILISSILGVFHLDSLYKEDKESSFDRIFQTLLLAIFATTSAAIPLLFVNSVQIALGGLFFMFPDVIFNILIEWSKRPVYAPPSTEIVPYQAAIVEGALIPSKYFFVFHVRQTSSYKSIGFTVNPKKLFSHNNRNGGTITLQKLLSNFVHRHNRRVDNSDLIHTTFLQNDIEKNIKWVFFKKRFFFFKKYYFPERSLGALNLYWKPGFKIIEGRIRFIWIISIEVYC